MSVDKKKEANRKRTEKAREARAEKRAEEKRKKEEKELKTQPRIDVALGAVPPPKKRGRKSQFTEAERLERRRKQNRESQARRRAKCRECLEEKKL
jgi:hypothetical protein